MDICNIAIYQDIDPFFLESQIIGLQRIWRFRVYHKHKYDIIKNFNIIGNTQDPISLNSLIKEKYINNIDNLYPIYRNDRLFIYELSSLNEIINNNMNEIYSNEPFSNKELSHIKFLLGSKINKKKNKGKLTKKEELYFLKINIFQIFYELGTYFTLSMYESIDKNNLQLIFNELKSMWTSFKQDYQINEEQLFGKKLDWKKIPKIELKLLENINILVNNNIDDIFKKNICYLIIGSFCYIDPNLKKIYNNIDFI
jgi:hypothetical protein